MLNQTAPTKPNTVNTPPGGNNANKMKLIVGGAAYNQYVIPHDIYSYTDPASPYKALTIKDFLDRVEYIKRKVLEVSKRTDNKFMELEAKDMLDKLTIVIPILNDKKDFLLENRIINGEGEYQDLKNTILNLLDRPTIKNWKFFLDFRKDIASYTETGKLQNGFENIGTIKAEVAEILQQKEGTKQEQEEKKPELIPIDRIIDPVIPQRTAEKKEEEEEPSVTVSETPGRTVVENNIFSLAISNEPETLNDLVKLSPLGRKAIWPYLNEEQRKYLNQNPYKPEWQGKFNNFAYEKFFDPAGRLVRQVDEDMGFKGLRVNIKNTYDNFKEHRKQQIFRSADRGNAVASWTKRKYLEYRARRDSRQSLVRLGGYLGGQALKTIISPITNTVEYIKDLNFIRRGVNAFQGVNNFAGRTLNTIGRVGGTLTSGMKFAILPTIVSSLMGLNPLIAAGLFSGIGIAKQAFNSVDLFKSQVGFKLPFIDNQLRRMAVLNELRINPQRYATEALDKFGEANRSIVAEFRANPTLAQSGRLFGAAKHLLGAVPFASVATGLGFFLSGGSLPLALLAGGGALAGKAAAGMFIERISGLMGRGLASFPLFRHIFKLPGMSFLGIADGANWVRGQIDYIKEKGFGSWIQSQGETQFNLGPVSVSKGMVTGIRSVLIANDVNGIFKWFGGIASSTSVAGGGFLGSLLTKIPLLTRIVAPIAIISSIGLAAAGAISWSAALGIIFGAVAGSLTLALLTSTGIGALIGIPASMLVSHYASKLGNWVGGFFDKTAEVLNDLNIVSLIPIVQLGKAVYDIVNATIEELGDYARIGLISLSIIPAFGVLIQLAEQQANANFESGNTTSVSTQTFNSEETGENEYSYTLENFEYDCEKLEPDRVLYAELPFKTVDIIATNSAGVNYYNLKGTINSGEIIIFKSMKNINPDLRIDKSVFAGEVIGSCSAN
jgi:hypothetical protein